MVSSTPSAQKSQPSAGADRCETSTAPSAANPQASPSMGSALSQLSADRSSPAMAPLGTGVPEAAAARETATTSGRRLRPSATASATRDQASQRATRVLIASPHDLRVRPINAGDSAPTPSL